VPGGATTGLIAAIAAMASAYCALVAGAITQSYFSRFAQILIVSAIYSIPVWLWTVVFTIRFVSLSERTVRPSSLDGFLLIALNGFRFYPLIVFFSVGLPGAFAAVLALGMNTAEVLVSMSIRGDGWRPVSERRLAIAIGYAVEAAVVFHYLREPFLSALALSAASAGMLALSLIAGVTSAELGSSFRKCASSVVLALAVTTWFTVVGGSPIARAIPATPAAPPSASVADNKEGPAPNIGNGGLYGVVLWPEIEPETRLVAPLPVWQNLSRGAMSVPTTIRFSGEYWMFRLPYRRPPRSSYLRRGNPAKLFFRTIAGDPLMMEAQQKLDLPVALSCCDRIEMAIRDVDPHPGSITLEMILIDSSSGASQSLGSQMVGTSGRGSEQIRFAIPTSPAIAEFNTIKVIFHRDRLNRDRSARIAIERFVLQPKKA